MNSVQPWSLLPEPPIFCTCHITIKNDLLLLVLHLKGCGCSQSGTLRTAGHPVLWNQPWKSPHCRCCCCGMGALCWSLTKTLLGQAGGCGGRPASPAAGRTEALCSCTSCCKDAPYLCCCKEAKDEREKLEETKKLVSMPLSTSEHAQKNVLWPRLSSLFFCHWLQWSNLAWLILFFKKPLYISPEISIHCPAEWLLFKEIIIWNWTSQL